MASQTAGEGLKLGMRGDTGYGMVVKTLICDYKGTSPA